MKKAKNCFVVCMMLALVASFYAGPAFAQGFSIDFSSAAGFGVQDPEKIQTNNVFPHLGLPGRG